MLAALLGALAVAGPASAKTLRGVVVHHDRRAHSFTVALSSGQLIAVHARRSPAVGRKVRVAVSRLRNGTYSLHSAKAGGRARRALIRGVVTFRNAHNRMFTVSATGVSVLVHAPAAAGPLPSVGDDVEVETEIDDQGDLQDEGVQTTGDQTDNIDLEGTILAVDPAARTLTVSADDDEQSGSSVTVDVPSPVDVSQFVVGAQVELTVAMQPDGSFVLVASSEDGNSDQADQQSGSGDGHGDLGGSPS